MSLKFDELTPATQQKLEAISKQHGITTKELMIEYLKIYNSGFVAHAPSEPFRQEWAGKLLYSNWYNRPPLKDRNVIPVGIGTVNKFEGSEAYQRLLAYDEATEKMIGISITQKALGIAEDIVFGEYYEAVKIGVTQQGTFQIDDRTELPDPTEFLGGEGAPENLDELLTEYLKVKTITMQDLENSRNWSKKFKTQTSRGERENVVETDWKIIRGAVINSNSEFEQGGRGSGFKRGRLMFTDATVLEDKILRDGTVLPTQMLAWVDTRFLFPQGTICDVYGTVDLNKFTRKNRNTGKDEKVSQFQMNAYLVNALYIGEVEEEEGD